MIQSRAWTCSLVLLYQTEMRHSAAPAVVLRLLAELENQVIIVGLVPIRPFMVYHHLSGCN